MIKKLLITVLVFLTLCSNVFGEVKSNQSIELIYFGTESCAECQETSTYLKSVLNELNGQGITVDFKYYDTLDPQNELLHVSYATAYGIPQENIYSIPIIFIGEKYLGGKDSIKKNIKNVILDYYSGNEEYKTIEVQSMTGEEKANINERILDNFVFLGVFLAGFLDGINPCSIAMLLFFISYISIAKTNRKSILIIGMAFTAGIFIAYLGIGIGLFRFTYIFKEARNIIIFIYSATIIMSVYLAFLNIRDFIRIKKGNYRDVKTQLPSKIKHLIHNHIRKHFSDKVIWFSAFVSGFIISFLEFFCTGQIYLPTISFVLSSGSSIVMALFYLLTYNIAFVAPLIIICLSIYYGKEVIDISQVLVNKLHWIKLLGAIFFIAITIFMLIKVTSIV